MVLLLLLCCCSHRRYIAFCALDAFTKNYYVRLQTLLSEMTMLGQAIDCADKDPNTIVKANRALTKHARELIILEEILTFMLESVSSTEIPPEPPEQAGRTLFERLELHSYKQQLQNRIEDMHKNLAGARCVNEIDMVACLPACLAG